METYFLNITYKGDDGEARWGNIMVAAVNELEATLITKQQFKEARVKSIRGMTDVIGKEKEDFFKTEGDGEILVEIKDESNGVQ